MNPMTALGLPAHEVLTNPNLRSKSALSPIQVFKKVCLLQMFKFEYWIFRFSIDLKAASNLTNV